MPGCIACATFETDSKAEYEAKEDIFRGVHTKLTWDCSSPEHRRLALEAGVDELPAYVFIPARPDAMYIQRPPM